MTSPAMTTFPPNDPSNPRNWPHWRKWLIVASIGLVDCTVSFGASGYSPASSSFAHEFHAGHFISQLGLSLYVLGLAFGPMFIAPLSEYYGRTALYLIPYGIFVVLLAGTAVVQTLPGFLALRLLSGSFASVTIANFGGTIADLWPRHDVGPAMNVFLWAAVCGSPLGYFIMSFVAQNHGWRVVIWTLFGICGVSWVQMAVVLLVGGNETRHSVILRRRARMEGKEGPEARGLGDLFKVTLARPFRLLTTEPIVVFGALYNGFLYGLSFMFNSAFGLVFGSSGYDFSTIGIGLSFLGLVLGISLGPIIGIWQERYYQRQIRTPQKSSSENESQPLLDSTSAPARYIPEARVQLAKVAALLLPVYLFIFAWTTHLHPLIPIASTVLFGFSFFTLIYMIAVYTEESYMVYSASALAGIGLVRNLFGTVFPLFGVPMFEKLGTHWAGTVIGAGAVVLAPVPFVLERWGPELRRRSAFAREHGDDE